MENNVYEKLVEYILFKRDRNPQKDWGHIWGWTTIFAYSKFPVKEEDFSTISKYFKSDFDTKDEFISMLRDWHFGNYERNFLEKYNFQDNYLYNFLYAISFDKHSDKIYYFRFSEKIDEIGENYLIKSIKQNPNYLFSHIALASYYFHNKKLKLALKEYLFALKLDKTNPYVLAKLSNLYNSLGDNESALKIMKTVVNLDGNSPWTNAWYGESLNKMGLYFEALKHFEIYENLTENKHRTFEPFMRKSESYIGLGDFKKAREYLNKKNIYYLGEGYNFIYEDLEKRLISLGY